MKKSIFTLTSLLLIQSALFAEIQDHHRFFEIGVDADAGVSNNYFGVFDIMVSDLVIDLTKIAEDMPKNGLIIDASVDAQAYASFNLKDKIGIKCFSGFSGYGYGNIGKGLFEILGKGVAVNEERIIDLGLYSDLYIETGVEVFTEILSGWGMRFVPSLFAPIYHLSANSGYAKYESYDDGRIKASFDAPVDIYSIVPIDMSDVNISWDSLKDDMKVGFDLFFELERKLTRTLEVGAFTRIPIVPGTLGYKASTCISGSFEIDNILGGSFESFQEGFQTGWTQEELTFTEADKKVHRPFIFGMEAAWRPFGKWCKFSPKVSLVVRNPWSPEYHIFGEYNLRADVSLFNILGLNIGTAYEDLVFKQTVGFMLNLRLLEINAAVQFRGADFVKSFNSSGFTAMVSAKLGF